MSPPDAFRRAVLWVAVLNLAYFVVEGALALSIGSVSLIADGIDLLEDGSVNLLIFFAAAWSARRRAAVGTVLAWLILLPSVAAVWLAVLKVLDPSPPESIAMALTAGGALVVNVASALLLARHRTDDSSLTKAAWLSTRNDLVANVAIIAVAIIALWWPTGWLDLVVGVAILLLNADAAFVVWRTSRRERSAE